MSIVVTNKKDGSVSTSFTGCVVQVKTSSEQVMSDIWEYLTYATVFNNETGAFEKHFIRGEMESGAEKKEATEDASEGIKALYEATIAIEEAKKALARAEGVREEALREVRCPSKGKTLKVVRGRKIKVGTVGECTWYGEGRSFSPFRSSYRSPAQGPMRVGIKMADGSVEYTDAHNVEVVIG